MKPTTLRVVRGSTIRALESIVIEDGGSEAAKKAGEIVASISKPFETQGLLVRFYRKVPVLRYRPHETVEEYETTRPACM